MNYNKKKKVAKAYTFFLIIIFLLMTFPVYAIANRVFPLMLGLPFGLFWIVLMEVAAFFVLFCFYRYEYGRGEDHE